MTDGGLESTLQALTLGKQLSSNVTLRNVVASKSNSYFIISVLCIYKFIIVY
jgi:hypothetical protein